MAETPYAVRRANPRFPFFANCEVTIGETCVRAQVSELSLRGCYLDTLEPIPVGTALRLRISDDTSVCELPGKVIYLQSGGGMGVFGMGVVFGEMNTEQNSAIEAWLRGLARQAR
jgi:hypothetical protein